MKSKQPALFKKSPNIILVGILFGLFYWIVDAIIEVFLFYKGTLVENLATPDSDQIWMRSFILFMFIVFSVTIQRVLNKRKSAEEALKESEERYRRLAGASSEGIVIHDGTRIIDVNQIFVDASGYELHELLEMSPLECLADESREKAAAYIRDGYEEPYEAVAQRKDGSTFPVEINARTVPRDGRQVRVAAVKDISERKKAKAEQHDIDGNYKTLFNSGNDPVLVFSLSEDGRPENFWEANEIACKKLGYNREELLQLSLPEITAEAERENLFSILQTLQDFKHTIFELEILTGDGTAMPVEISSHLIDMDGNAIIISSLRETVERKKAEESLRLSEKRFREMYEESPMAGQILDNDAHIVDVNEKWLELLEYDREDIISRWMGEFIAEARLDSFKAGFADFLDTGQLQAFETEMVKKDGTLLPVSLDGKLIHDGLGQSIHAYCTVRDFSEEIKIRAALKEKETNIKSLIDGVENIIFVFNPDGTIADLNPIFDKITGLPGDSWIGRNFSSLIHPDDQDFAQQTLRKCARGDKIPPIELRVQTQSGEYLNMEFSLSSEGQDGRVDKIHGLAIDLTKRWKQSQPEKIQETKGTAQPDYQTVIDSLIDPVHVIDKDMKVVLINKTYREICRQFNLSTDIVGKNIFESFPFVSDKFEADYRRIFETGEIDTSEETINIGDNEIIFEARRIPIFEEGKVGCILSQIRIITEEKKAESAMKESEKRFRQIAENINQVFWMSSLDESQLIYVSPAYEEIWGRTCQSLYVDPHSWAASVHEDDRQRVEEAWKNRTDGDFDIEYRIVRPDNTIRWIKDKAFPVRDDGGEIYRVAGIAEDITARKHYEMELVAERDFSENIIKTAQAIIMVLDREGRILSVNPYMEELSGYTIDEIKGKCWLEIFLSEDKRDKVHSLFTVGTKDAPKGTITVEIKTKTGEYRIIEWNNRVIKDTEGNIIGVLATGQDITERRKNEELIRREHDLSARLAETSPAGITVVNKEGQIIFANDAAEKVLGLTKDEITQRNYNTPEWKITDFDGSPFPDDKLPFTTVKKTNQSVRDVHHAIEWPDGRRVLLSINAAPLYDAAGSFDGIVATVENITERIMAEKSLKENEERLRLAVQNIPAMVCAFDEEHILCVWNRECEKVTGYSAEEMIGNPRALEYLYPDKEYFEKLKRERAKKGDFRNWEREITCKDVSKKILSWSNVSQEYPIPGWASWGFGFDVTESKRAEKALRSSEERYRLLIENATEGIVVAQNGVLKFVNQRVEEFTKFKREELLSKPFIEFVLDDDKEKVMEYHRTRLEGKSLPKTYEIRAVDREGNLRWIEVSGVSITWNGQPASLNFLNDITERKKTEEELARAEKLESVGLLAGGIAHDFNNILTAILGNITLAKMSIDPGHEIMENLTDAEKASVRAQDLTRQLLTFSKGGAPVRKTASIVEILKESAAFALRGSNVKCTHDYPDDLACVEIDEGQISQVISNLIINADQAMPDGGMIKLKAINIEVNDEDTIPLKADKYVKITIEDDGVGIPDEHLPRIFDPYFTTKQRGSGLGLATAYSIIKNHNGFIDVKSQLGKGTIFSIYLPASTEHSAAESKDKVKSVSGQGRILIMDDEESIRKVAGVALGKLGYEVDFATSGDEMIDKYRDAANENRPFNAVIMDLTIPGGMGGKEAIGKLREIDPDVKAIVSSGYYNDPIMSEYQQYGFAGVILKPYKAGDLGTLVYQILSGGKVPTQ